MTSPESKILIFTYVRREADFIVKTQLKIRKSLLALIFKQITPNLEESISTP